MKQKIKYLMMVAIVAMTSIVAFTSCSDDDSPASAAVANNNAINFNVEAENVKGTRADVTTSNLTSFNVIALSRFTTPTSNVNTNYFFGNDKGGITYTKNGTSWTCGKDYYWPVDSTLSFIAYKGLNSARHSFVNLQTSAPTLKVQKTIDLYPLEQDFVIAYAPNLNKANTATGTVNLQFKHPYSKLNVYVDKSKIKDNWEISIAQVLLTVYEGANYNIATGSWSSLSDLVQVGDFDANDYSTSNSFNSNKITKSNGIQSLLEGDSWYIIPQKINYICLNVGIYDKSTNKWIVGSGDRNNDSNTPESLITIPIKDLTMEAGKAYTINLYFNGTGTDVTDENGKPVNLKINYNVTVDNYTTVTPSTLNI